MRSTTITLTCLLIASHAHAADPHPPVALDVPAAPLGVDHIVLPLAGLELDLAGEADQPGYPVSGQWSLGDDGFSSIDVIEELRLRKSASKTIVNIDRLMSEDCMSELDALPMPSGTPAAELELFESGAPLVARIGQWDVGAPSGLGPALAYCVLRPGDRRRMLVIRTLTDAKANLPKAQLLARMKSSALMAELRRAYLEYHTAAVQPAWSPDVEGSGLAAARAVKLPQTYVKLKLPDDGFVWSLDASRDSFVRRAPAEPELTLDVIQRPHEGCVQSFYELNVVPAKNGSAKNLPSGWLVGGETFIGGVPMTVICRLAKAGTLSVAVHRVPTMVDWKELAPMLDTLSKAVGSELAVGTAVEVEWRGSWLEAHIIEARGGSYYVDFDDKNDAWNEWVPRERVRLR